MDQFTLTFKDKKAEDIVSAFGLDLEVLGERMSLLKVLLDKKEVPGIGAIKDITSTNALILYTLSTTCNKAEELAVASFYAGMFAYEMKMKREAERKMRDIRNILDKELGNDEDL